MNKFDKFEYISTPPKQFFMTSCQCFYELVLLSDLRNVTIKFKACHLPMFILLIRKQVLHYGKMTIICAIKGTFSFQRTAEKRSYPVRGDAASTTDSRRKNPDDPWQKSPDYTGIEKVKRKEDTVMSRYQRDEPGVDESREECTKTKESIITGMLYRIAKRIWIAKKETFERDTIVICREFSYRKAYSCRGICQFWSGRIRLVSRQYFLVRRVLIV